MLLTTEDLRSVLHTEEVVQAYHKEVKWAMMNWDTRPGSWEKHLRQLMEYNQQLLTMLKELTEPES